MNDAGRPSSSVKRAVVLPSLLTGAAIAGLTVWAIEATSQRELAAGLHKRAALVANMVNYAAEGMSRPGELQRIVAAIGADQDVLDIVVVGGQPARVLATTRGVWLGKLLRELPREEVAEDLEAAMRARVPQSHFNAQLKLYDLSVPLLFSQAELTDGSVSDGAVMVHLDTRPMERAVQRDALVFSAFFIVGLALLGTIVYRRVERLILQPIAGIARRVTSHEQGASEPWPESNADSELGVLARTLHGALLRSDAALHDLANQKHAIDEHSIVAVTDAAGKITYVNDRFCAISKYSREELLGQDHRIVNSGYHSKEFIADLWRTLRRGKVWRGELRNRAKDGSFYWVESTLVPLPGPNGKPHQFIAIRTDVTERKQAAAALVAAKAAAEAASAAKSEFLANMSHEIRTPMNAVIGMTGLLLDGPLDSGQRAMLETVRLGSEALLGIINDVLDYSKVEAGRLELEQHPFDPRELVEAAVELFSSQAADRGLELLCDVADDVPPMLLGDATRLRQIVLNLLSNALKFTLEGEVSLALDCTVHEPQAVELRMQVRDTGIGIPEDKRGQLFKPFTQADGSTTRRFGGTGLGLAISRHFTKLMGGELRLESECERGSTFVLTCRLPRVPSGAPDAQPVPVVAVGRTVLVVDDNASCRAQLERRLKSYGAEVRSVGSVGEALALARTDPAFDVALLDEAMTGPEVSERGEPLRSSLEERGTRVVLLTRRPVAGGSEHGALQITKPIKPHALLSALRRTLDADGAAVDSTARPPKLTTALADEYPLRILLAEDNPVNQRVATMILDRMGYHVTVVSDGVAALAALSAREHDVVFMDVHMPEMDGLETTRKLRQQALSTGYRPWIVALTASAMDAERHAAKEAGMDDFLSKPVRIEDLQHAVVRAAEARAAQRAVAAEGALP